jgi:hypothetical protein
LTQPTPEGLWRLRGHFLTAIDALPPEGREGAGWTLEIADAFHGYLADLRGKMTAREYSRFASQLDVGSVGMLAVQDLVTEREHLWESLFLGGLSEGLMVMATLQYTKAWEAQMALTHDRVLWWLFEALWRLSGVLRPNLDAGARRELIDSLLAPARSGETPTTVKMALLVRLFQVLLLGSLGWMAPLLAGKGTSDAEKTA